MKISVLAAMEITVINWKTRNCVLGKKKKNHKKLVFCHCELCSLGISSPHPNSRLHQHRGTWNVTSNTQKIWERCQQRPRNTITTRLDKRKKNAIILDSVFLPRESKWYEDIFTLQTITNVQNICNLIGREECKIDRIVTSVSILYSLTEKQQHLNVVPGKDRNVLI